MTVLQESKKQTGSKRCEHCVLERHLVCSFCRRQVHETVWPDNIPDFFARIHNIEYRFIVCIDCCNKGIRWPEPKEDTVEEEEDEEEDILDYLPSAQPAL